MKKILFILMAIFATTFTSYAQITTMSAFEKKVEKVAVEYDVTKNFLGSENVESYVGQVLYVNRNSVTSDFVKSKKISKYDSSNWCQTPLGEYFKVLDVEFTGKNYVHSTFEEYNEYILTLQNVNDENEIIYFHYGGKYEHSFPFIVVTHFEWCKTNLIGINYKLTYHHNNDEIEVYHVVGDDVMTGEKVKHNINDTWECIDITTIKVKNEYEFVMLLRNQNGNVIAYKMEWLDNNDDGEINVLIDIEYQKLVTKYGKTMVDAVRQHRIRIGMTKDLLIMSWGEPDEINSNSYGADQWVYGTQYVYVNNGKVEGWN